MADTMMNGQGPQPTPEAVADVGVQGLDIPPPPMEPVGELPQPQPQQDQLWKESWTPTIEDVITAYDYKMSKGEQLKTPEEMLAITEQKAQDTAFSVEDDIARQMLRQDTLQKAINNHLTSVGVTSDTAKRAWFISQSLGVPQGAVLSDMPRYEKEFATKKLVTDIQGDDALVAFYSNLDNFQRAKDDAEGLGVISRTAGGLARGYTGAGPQRTQSIQNLYEIMSGKPPTLFPRQESAPDWAGWIGEQTGGLVGSLQDSTVYAGLPTAGVAGVAGSVVPAIGNVVGAGGGFAAGLATDQTLQQLGTQVTNTYLSVLNNGGTQEEAIKQARNLALLSSPVQLGLNFAPVGGAVSRLGSAVLGKTEGTVAGNIAKSVTAGAVEGGLTNAISEGISASADYQALTNLGISLPENADSVVKERVLTALGLGVAGGGAIGGAGSVLGHAINRVRTKAPEAEHIEQTLLQVTDALALTKTAEEDPQTLSNFLQVRLAGETGENSHLPLDKVQEMALKHPEAFAKIAESVPDLEEQIKIAVDTGADVTLPTHAVLSYLQQDAKAFIPDIKVTPEGMSGNEARQAVTELTTQAKEAVDNAVAEVNQGITSGEFVRRESLRRTLEDGILKAFGPTFTKKQRKDLSEFYTSTFEATAKANNYILGDALDEYIRRPILFQKSAEQEAQGKAAKKIISEANRRKSKAEAQQIISAQVKPPSVVTGEGGELAFRGTKLGDGAVYVGEESVPTEVMVVEADTLSPSFTFDENQPRNRDANISELQITDIVQKFKADRLKADSPDIDRGAPTLTRDGRIVGGNGRVEAIKRKYLADGAPAYRAMVEEEATKAGISIGGMKNPVLVRVFKGDVDVGRASILSNKRAGLEYSPIEQARVDASTLPDVTRFVFNENGMLSPTGNHETMREYLSKISVEEQAGFVDKDGDLTTAGQRRVQNAILYRAYGDTPLLGRMIEDISPEGVNINTAMTRIAPEMMRIEGQIAEGKLHNLSLKDDLLKAIDAYLYMKRKGGDVQSYLAQSDMFGGEATPEVGAFLQLLEDNSRSPRGLAKAILDAYRQIESLGDPQVGNLFVDEAVPTKAEILGSVQKETKTLNQGARGALTFGDGDIPKMMSLFKDGDISTMIHEKGHGILQDLRADALDERLAGATQRKEDWRATKDWFIESTPYLLNLHKKENVFGSKRAERKAELEALKEIEGMGGAEYVKQFVEGNLDETMKHGDFLYKIFHEVFARGTEQYVREGKAPNSRLAGVFQRFAEVLVKLYKAVEALNAPINDQMREVFGRLISADQETARARTEQSLDPLFPDQKSSGMSEYEYQKYMVGAHEQKTKHLEKIIKKQMLALKKEKTEEGKSKIEANATRIEKAIRADKPMQAFTAMGELKLDEAEITARQMKGLLPPELVAKEGLSLESVAELLGYESVDMLGDDLARLEKMRRDAGKASVNDAVKVTAERQARQEFLDEIDPENLYNEAVDTMHLSGFEDSLTLEINALSRMIDGEEVYADPTAPLTEFANLLPEVMTIQDLRGWIKTERATADKGASLLGTSRDFFKSFVNRREQKLARIMQDKGLKAIDKTLKAIDKTLKDVASQKKKTEAVQVRVSELNYEAMQEYVKEIYDNDTTGKITNPERFLAQERKSGEKAQNLFLEGKPVQAFQKKVDQILAQLMYEEGRKRGREALQNIDAKAVEARVTEQLANMDMVKVISSKNAYLNSERSSGASALNHMKEGKFRQAVNAKMRQLTSFTMYKKSLEFIAFKKTADRLYKKISQNKTLKNVSDDAMALMHLILQDQGYKTARSQRASRADKFEGELQFYFGKGKDGEPLSLHEAIQAFLSKESVSSREAIYIPEEFKVDRGFNKYTAITVAQHQDLYRMMMSIYTHGREEQTLYMNGRREDREKTVLGIVETALRGRGEIPEDNRATPDSIPRAQALKESVLGFANRTQASIIRASTIIHRLARGDGKAPINVLWANLNASLGMHREFQDGFNQRIMELSGPKGWGKEKFIAYIDGLNNTFIPAGHGLGDHNSPKHNELSMRRLDVLTMFINSGTHDNFQKLVRGRAKFADETPTGWTEEAVNAFFMKHITRQDIEFAQIIWQEVGKLWPDLEAVEKRIRGIAPDKLITRTITTKFGEIEGGYFPLRYEDIGNSTVEMTRMEDIESFGDAMNGMIASSSKNRLTNVTKPVSLNLWRGIEEVNRSAYAVYVVEAYNDMAKVLNDRRVSEAVTHVFSKEHYQSLRDLMEDIKSPNRRSVGMTDYVEKMGKHLTAGMMTTYFVMIPKAGIDGLFDTISLPFKKDVPKLELISATQRMFHSPKEEWKWALQFDAVKDVQSTGPQRWSNWKQDVQNRYGAPSDAFKQFVEIGRLIQETTTMFNATVSARAVYENYVKKNPMASQEEIHNEVNRVVRSIVPDYNILHAPLVRRNKSNQSQKLWLRYSSQATNAILDAWYPLIDRIKAKEGAPEGSTAKDTAIFVASVVGAAIPYVGYLFLAGKLPIGEDGEIDKTKLALMTAGALATQGHPIFRDFADVITQPDNPFAGGSLNPEYRDLVRATKDAMKIIDGGDFGERQFFNFVKAGGTAFNVPTGPIRIGGYIANKTLGGEELPETTPDIIQGLGRGYD